MAAGASLFAQTQIPRTWMLKLNPSAIAASSFFPQEGAVTYLPQNLLDADEATSWFNAREDTVPWVKASFDRDVIIQAIAVKNGWWKDDTNWNYNNRVKNIEILFSDGNKVDWTLRDDRFVQTIPGSIKAVRSAQFTVLSKHDINRLTGSKVKFSEAGMTDIGFFGRIPEPGAISFKEMAQCTVEFLTPVTIKANSARSKELESEQIYIFGSEDVDQHPDRTVYDYDADLDSLGFYVKPSASSPNDRVIKEGRKFTVVNVVARAEIDLTMVCDDGTSLVFMTVNSGGPYAAYGSFNMQELNTLFSGRIRFTDARKRATEEY